MVLKDPVRSFWISTLDCWRIFGVFLFRKDFVIFIFVFIFRHSFFFPIIFGIFKQGFFFFFFFGLIFLICISFYIFFSPRAGKQGIMGPGFI